MRPNVEIFFYFLLFFYKVKEKQKNTNEIGKLKEQKKAPKNIKNDKTLRKRLRNEVY